MIKSVYNRTECFCKLVPKECDFEQNSIKGINQLETSEIAIKIWKPVNFFCKLSKIYLQNVFFYIEKSFET